MDPVPFGHNLLLWRQARGLTQMELAQRARMAQSNLSDIERGVQDVSLRTLRALAVALSVRPGLLADGVPPRASGRTSAVLNRAALERIAAMVGGRRVALHNDEQGVVDLLRPLVQRRVGVLKGRATSDRAHTRAAHLAWMALRARYPRAMIDSLIQRVSEQAARP